MQRQARAVELLAEAAASCNDDTRLQRVVPYLMVRVTISLPLLRPSCGASRPAELLDLAPSDVSNLCSGGCCAVAHMTLSYA